jgi:predicted AAA+ superfamily ATPase
MALSAEQLAKILAAADEGVRRRSVARLPDAPWTRTEADIYVFPVPTDVDVRWVLVIDRTGVAPRVLLVPADGNPLVGPGDVEFTAEPGRESLVARCRFFFFVTGSLPGGAVRVGRMPNRGGDRLLAAIQRMETLHFADHETAADPAYTEWCAAVAAAAQKLRSFLAAPEPPKPQSNRSLPTGSNMGIATNLKPWREIAVPRPDVLKGTFRQSEFAADITAVRTGKAPSEYKDAAEFFERTYITEGMRRLLTQVAQRLSGAGGDPVIQLQTSFGGGKTHTMLAVWHLATRTCPLSELRGIPTIIEQAGLMDVPQARVAVLDGTAHAPGQPWKHGRTTVKTLWGELAWQLGGAEAFALVKESDASGTSPSKEDLAKLLEAYAPCVVLVDELVAYIRQFPEGQPLSGGSFESNISFVQALTEAIKPVTNAVLLASLPESDANKSNAQLGGARGLQALQSLEATFGRVQALWRPVGTEESFEIVRRRLFEPIKSEQARNAVCRAFADAYAEEGARLPSETQEGRYYDRLCQAYPIHPEVFDRLYEDWTTIDGFQRTRGVLKLMAQAIHRLWKDNNSDLLIMPGSLPLYASEVRNELTYLLPPGWEPVIDGDIDGDRAETTELESKEPRFGAVNAARRVARTLFLGTAPSSVATKQGIRGQDRGRVLLGCVQPGQTGAVYSDALDRLIDRCHHLYPTGDKSDDKTRYWFDTRANLRREMEDRKRRFDDSTDVRKKIEDATRKLFGGAAFDAVHVFTPAADVPDDGALRLVILSPDQYYLRDSPRLALDAVSEYLRSHGAQPRHRANRLLFVAPDSQALNRLRDVARTAMAWGSIVDDVEEGKLNIDQNQRKQAEKEAKATADVVPRAARECFRWLLAPVQDDPQAEKPTIEPFALNTSGGTVPGELDRVCKENELVIGEWSPTHLREHLKRLYWKPDRPAVGAQAFWEDSLRYLYLPRLRDRDVFAAAVRTGAAGRDFFGTAYGRTGDTYDGFQLGGGVSFNDTLLLIEPEAAKVYEAARKKAVVTPASDTEPAGDAPAGAAEPIAMVAGSKETSGGTGPVPTPKARTFTGAVGVPAATARMKLIQIAEEIIERLTADPTATVKVTVEITADFDGGVGDATKRTVSENATSLGFHTKEWE